MYVQCIQRTYPYAHHTTYKQATTLTRNPLPSPLEPSTPAMPPYSSASSDPPARPPARPRAPLHLSQGARTARSSAGGPPPWPGDHRGPARWVSEGPPALPRPESPIKADELIFDETGRWKGPEICIIPMSAGLGSLAFSCMVFGDRVALAYSFRAFLDHRRCGSGRSISLGRLRRTRRIPAGASFGT